MPIVPGIVASGASQVKKSGFGCTLARLFHAAGQAWDTLCGVWDFVYRYLVGLLGLAIVTVAAALVLVATPTLGPLVLVVWLLPTRGGSGGPGWVQQLWDRIRGSHVSDDDEGPPQAKP